MADEDVGAPGVAFIRGDSLHSRHSRGKGGSAALWEVLAGVGRGCAPESWVRSAKRPYPWVFDWEPSSEAVFFLEQRFPPEVWALTTGLGGRF